MPAASIVFDKKAVNPFWVLDIWNCRRAVKSGQTFFNPELMLFGGFQPSINRDLIQALDLSRFYITAIILG